MGRMTPVFMLHHHPNPFSQNYNRRPLAGVLMVILLITWRLRYGWARAGLLQAVSCELLPLAVLFEIYLKYDLLLTEFILISTSLSTCLKISQLFIISSSQFINSLGNCLKHMDKLCQCNIEFSSEN